MKTIIITWLACLCFALYNAFSIKGFTNTWQWHLTQFASVGLFVFSDIAGRIGFLISLWKWKDFHNFGKCFWRYALVGIVAVAIYVESLHYFLKIVKDLF